MLTFATRHDRRFDLMPAGPVLTPHQELEQFGLLNCDEEHTEEAAAKSNPEASDDSRPDDPLPEVVRYRSLFDLREQWKRLDCAEFAFRLTIVLLLRANFAGHLAGLIRRRHPALRLLISCESGPLPARGTMGDMIFRSASLGWHLISFHRTFHDAVTDGMVPLTWRERCVLFCPTATGEIRPVQGCAGTNCSSRAHSGQAQAERAERAQAAWGERWM